MLWLLFAVHILEAAKGSKISQQWLFQRWIASCSHIIIHKSLGLVRHGPKCRGKNGSESQGVEVEGGERECGEGEGGEGECGEGEGDEGEGGKG